MRTLLREGQNSKLEDGLTRERRMASMLLGTSINGDRMNTSETLMIASAIVPDRDAIVFNGERFSFEALQERVNRLANAMSELGVGRGDRLAAMQTNCNHLIELYFASAQLDAIYVPINFRAKEDELATMLGIVEPSFLFLGERYLPLAAAANVPDEPHRDARRAWRRCST